MGLYLYNKHRVSVCICAVLAKLISVFSVKASARTTQKLPGYRILSCRGWGRMPLISLDIKGREVWGSISERMRTFSMPLTLLPGRMKYTDLTLCALSSPITTCCKQCLVPAPVFWSQWSHFQEWTPMLWISATLFLSLPISLTGRLAIPTSYKGHREAAAHT